MTNVSEMTNEDLLRAYWKNCRKAPHAFDDKLDNDLYEELLRRLNRLTTLEANERMAYGHNQQISKQR